MGSKDTGGACVQGPERVSRDEAGASWNQALELRCSLENKEGAAK